MESGSGVVNVGGKEFEIQSGDIAFIDCSKPYSHSTPATLSSSTHSSSQLKKVSGENGNDDVAEEKNGGVAKE